MPFSVRFVAAPVVLALTIACASPSDQPAPEPIITTMPMDVPAGADLILTLETPVSSETAKPDQPVRAAVAKPVVVGGMDVVPVGAPVSGVVVSADRVKGRASIALRFNEVTVLNTPYRIATANIAREAGATKGKDAKTIASGATGGDEVTIPAGATLSTTITETVRIVMPM